MPYPQDYVAVYIPEASVVFYGQCIFTEGHMCYVKLAPARFALQSLPVLRFFPGVITSVLWPW